MDCLTTRGGNLQKKILTEETAFADSVQETARFAVLANVQADPEIGTENSAADQESDQGQEAAYGNLLELQYFPSNMDETTYKARLLIIDDEAAKVKRRIAIYSAEDVSVADQDTFKSYLDRTREIFEHFQELVYKLRRELDASVPIEDTRITQIKNAEDTLMKKLKRMLKKSTK